MVESILLISEKPKSAERIAQALTENSVEKHGDRGAYWFEFFRNGKRHLCVPAVGHLFVLDTKDSNGWNYPVFDVEWKPSYTRKGSEFTKKYFNNIKRLAKKPTDFIVACDYDTEGEVIGFNILRFLCGKKNAKRMKFSTLTKSDIVEAYENVINHLDFGQAEAGLTRHYLDFIWGINTTRALTLAMKSFVKAFTLVSSGRVQSPTLKILADREIEIKKFVPVPFWQIELYSFSDGEVIVSVYEEDKIWKKEKAQKVFDECKGKDSTVKNIQKRKYKQYPPFPFDTTTLQTESYRNFGFSPTQTLSIAEALYTQGFISYPRTSGQKLPIKIGYKKIIKNLSKLFEKECKVLLAKKILKPREGKKVDPAHPAIFPTSQVPSLSKLTNQQRKIYELVVRRFLATFGDPAERESMKVTLNIDKYNFITTGHRTIEPGWILLYGRFSNFKERVFPELKKGQILKTKNLKMLAKETQPPGRYTQASILKELEKRSLGTKSTRAQILQTLYNRGYIQGKSIKVTKFGEQVVKVLDEFCPKIVSEKLTRKFEEEMEDVREQKKNREDVIEEVREVLAEILKEFKSNEKKIGESLSMAYITYKKNQKVIGKCPECGKGLRIIRSKRTKKRFVGCSGYKDGCRFSTPLPQTGSITATNKICKECDYPLIMLKFKRKRPFFSCINMKCSTKENFKNKD